MYDLATFRQRVVNLYREADPFPDHRRPSQQDLAREVGLAAAELSRRLHGKPGSRLTNDNVQAIVRALAKWEAIGTQAEALDLLMLVDCPSFNAAQWQQAPLDQLTPLSPQHEAAYRQLADNLPLPVSSFVGRVEDLAVGMRLLAHSRLITVTGMGGIGKTRFAIELAQRGQFGNGAWLVELAAITDAALVLRQIAAVLGCREQVGQALADTLIEFLRPRHLLLILDNCEHLAMACANIARNLLQHCPMLTILATSREPLGVGGESSLPLSPLSLPQEATALTASQIEEYEAVQLFVQRAQAAQPRFRLTSAYVTAMTEICRRLDGIPLALELAAPLVKSLTLEKIAQRLDDRFRLLTLHNPVVPTRQQTLRACIEWSYDLLAEDERMLLRRLAVFAGGWHLEAAEVICAAGGLAAEDVLAAHVQLVGKSLLVAEEQGGTMRYLLLDTVRAYASEQLAASGEEQEIRQRHALLYLALVEQAEPQLTGTAQVTWLGRLEGAYDNIRAALGWLIAQQQVTPALRMSAALWRFWYQRGYLSEGSRWLEAALSLQGNADDEVRAKALNGAGGIAYAQSNYALARAMYSANLELRRKRGDKHGIAGALNNLGLVAEQQGDYTAARQLYEESLQLKRELGDKYQIANTLSNLAMLVYELEDYPYARALHEESLALDREIGDAQGVAISLSNLSLILERQGDLAGAWQLCAESLAITRAAGNKVGIAGALSNMGMIACRQGNYPLARSLYAECIPLAMEMGLPYFLATMLESLANVVMGEGDYTAATQILAAAQSIRDATQTPIKPSDVREYEQTLAMLRELLGEQDFAAAWAKGQTMSAQEAVAAVLTDVPTGEQASSLTSSNSTLVQG